jgi:isoamylase
MFSSVIASACLSLGACLAETQIEFRVASENATRMEVCLFSRPMGEEAEECHLLKRETPTVWAGKVARPSFAPIYYGYRAWGPNWPYTRNWKPGTTAGFLSDVDRSGNRFNPNKLLLDPYALEISHGFEKVADMEHFNSGPLHRSVDTASIAPKGVISEALPHRNDDVIPDVSKPDHPLRSDVIYEVHVRGFTRNDLGLPAKYRGTYKGAALKAQYLKSLGVTAVEFLPVHAKSSPQAFPNFWGYMTVNYFAPEPAYAFDRSPGGPTREFREMVQSFHAAGIKVFIDVVYNHTAEGGVDPRDVNVSSIWSFRGLDNRMYYDTAPDPRYFMDNTGIGHNFATFSDVPRDLILDSLKYWKEILGVDGFRFDLAAVLGNNPRATYFYFDPDAPGGVLQRIERELPVRPANGGFGADLIAEPWAIGQGTFQQGRFPRGWAEWNGEAYRDPIRSFLNLRGVESVSIGRLAHAIAGSETVFKGNGRKPFHSINFITAHDGFTLRDLFSFSSKKNNLSYPWGPSDGGSDTNRSWDQGGDPIAQRQMARSAMLLLFTSAGTPMLLGGDELYRTQRGNNNPWNLDTEVNYLPWENLQAEAPYFSFVQNLIQFRHRHPELAPAEFFLGLDQDRNGLKDIAWYDRDGRDMAQAAFQADGPFLAWRVDSAEGRKRLKKVGALPSATGDVKPPRSVLVAINGGFHSIEFKFPAPAAGHAWFRVADSAAWMESLGNHHPAGQEEELGASYWLQPRSGILLVERTIDQRKRQTRRTN